MSADLDPSQNPYRTPAATDESGGSAPPGQRKRSRDLALVGLFLGTSYGAAAGAATTLSLGVIHALVQLVTEPGSHSLYSRVDEWITYYVALAALGALLGALSGAFLGHLQGLLAARRSPSSLPRLRRFAALCWAAVAAAWCLLIDQNTPSSASQTWMLYLALLVGPSAAGLSGAMMASRLARAARNWDAKGCEPDTSVDHPS